MNIEEQEQNVIDAKPGADKELNEEEKNLLSKKRLRNKVVKK
jgi:hypothetical protein